jgi:hypothetical protein
MYVEPEYLKIKHNLNLGVLDECRLLKGSGRAMDHFRNTNIRTLKSANLEHYPRTD